MKRNPKEEKDETFADIGIKMTIFKWKINDKGTKAIQVPNEASAKIDGTFVGNIEDHDIHH